MPCIATLFAALAVLIPASVPASATTVSTTVPPGATVGSSATSAASVPVESLRATGARTTVAVRRLHRTAQARWVDHVVDEHLVSIDGCLTDPSRYRFHRGTYRSTVYTLCDGGVATARAAARRLVASRPWYRVRVTPVPVVAFTLEADLEVGRGAPVEAALAELPHRDFTYAEGDDTWLVYVGQGVTQAQLDAARAAFAHALGITIDRVSVGRAPLG